MRLIRFGPMGQEKPGALDAGGVRRDLSAEVDDWAGAALHPDALTRWSDADLTRFPQVSDEVRLGPCVGGHGKIICIGLNYADHARESGAEPPVEPVIFMKPWSALAGPDDDLRLPPGSEKTDWEVELAVVVGRRLQHVEESDALAGLAGYAVLNDYSERAWQLEGTGTWDKGKGYDGFAPLGPWLVTPDEVGDPQDLGLWLEVNGTRLQDGSTRTMIFSVATLVSYVSHFMTLHPGDVIATGTPPGVGLGQRPPWYLKRGDVVELGIQGLGRQRQRIV